MTRSRAAKRKLRRLLHDVEGTEPLWIASVQLLFISLYSQLAALVLAAAGAAAAMVPVAIALGILHRLVADVPALSVEECFGLLLGLRVVIGAFRTDVRIGGPARAKGKAGG